MKIIAIIELVLRLIDTVIRAFRKKNHEDKIEEIREDPVDFAIDHFGNPGVRGDSSAGTVPSDQTTADDDHQK